MPKGPQGQKRPADSIGMSVSVAKIATGEAEEAKPSGRRASGLAGAKARAEALTSAKRSKIAKAAAEAKWSKKMDDCTKDDLHSFLFDEGRELVNIKFMPGDDPNLTIEQVRVAASEALRSAMSKGPHHSPPTTGRPKGALAPISE